MARYNTSGPSFIQVRNGAIGVVVVATLANLAIAGWFIYLLVTVAQHVHAWPF